MEETFLTGVVHQPLTLNSRVESGLSAVARAAADREVHR